MDAAQLRWWDGVNWTTQTMPATDAEPLAPVTPIAPEPAAPAAPEPPAPAAAVATAAPADEPGIYIPRNSVFKMAEAVDGQAYVPEWSGIADISDEIALSGVPVQLALTATPSEGPPIPVSADAFPILGVTPEPVVAELAAPAWQVEQPLSKPIDQLFPLAGPVAPAAMPTPTPAPTVPAFPVATPTPVAVAPRAPVAPAVVAVPPSDAFSIAVAHAPVDIPSVSSLSPDIFPTTAPAGALSAAPPPTGAIFPGLVPEAAEPSVVELAPAPAVSVPVLAAVPDLVEPVEIAAQLPFAVPVAEPVVLAPIAPQPIAAQPIAPQPIAPQPELYTGPTFAEAPVPTPFDAPAPSLAPLVPQTVDPGVGYEPLVARAIPQPAMFGSPVDVPAPVAEPAAATTMTSAATSLPTPTETAWPAEGTYQPHPGAYVPFDPNAVRVEEPLPAIPFSSRDPFNPASTSRPALRSYGAAPVGPSGSTYTPSLAIILVTPLLMAGGYALLFQLATINVGLAPNIALAALLGALFFVGIGAAQFDRNTLAKRGYFDLASPFWILLSPLVYLGVRASRLHSQGPGGIRAVFLWFAAWAGAAAILTFSTFAALNAVTPERLAQTEQAVAQQYTVDKVVPTVNCPDVPSFAPGTVFNCTATSASTVQLVQVTITNWTGGESYKLVSTTPVPAAAPATP